MKTQTRVPLAFDDVGDGEPVLLFLPGWAVNRTLFRGLLPLLAGSRRSIALDWHGHGGSAVPGGDFGTEELVEDALAVLDVAGVDRVVPVAQSHAGWVALELRRRLGPERVPALVLASWMVLGAPPPFFESLEALQNPARWEQARAELLERWGAAQDNPAVHLCLEEMADYGFEMWARAAREIGRSCRAEGAPLDALAALDVPIPTLHLYAQPADPAYLAAQEEAAARHEWFHVERLEAATHFPMLEVPEEVAAVIDGFVGEHAG